MSLWSRLRILFGAKATAALDRIEDPRQTLDYAYQQQQELLRNVKRGLVEVATSRRQLEIQVEKTRSRVPETEQQARQAIAAGREDLARMVLERKQTALAELTGLESQLAEVAAQEQKLTQAELDLADRVEEFRTRRIAMSAQYTASEAQVRVNETLAGVSSEFAELGMAVGRATEKMDRMQARASAIDTLIETGALTLPGGGDPLERQLQDQTAKLAVEQELAVLKAAAAQGLLPPPGGA